MRVNARFEKANLHTFDTPLMRAHHALQLAQRHDRWQAVGLTPSLIQCDPCIGCAAKRYGSVGITENQNLRQ